jgi:hypothetical protein
VQAGSGFCRRRFERRSSDGAPALTGLAAREIEATAVFIVPRGAAAGRSHATLDLSFRPAGRNSAWTAEQEALSFGTAGALEIIALPLRLHTFRSRPLAQAARELRDSLDDGTGIDFGEKVMDGGAINLDSIAWKSPQRAQ